MKDTSAVTFTRSNKIRCDWRHCAAFIVHQTPPCHYRPTSRIRHAALGGFSMQSNESILTNSCFISVSGNIIVWVNGHVFMHSKDDNRLIWGTSNRDSGWLLFKFQFRCVINQIQLARWERRGALKGVYCNGDFSLRLCHRKTQRTMS